MNDYLPIFRSTNGTCFGYEKNEINEKSPFPGEAVATAPPANGDGSLPADRGNPAICAVLSPGPHCGAAASSPALAKRTTARKAAERRTAMVNLLRKQFIDAGGTDREFERVKESLIADHL